jgi:hypothetical protein
VTFRVSDAQNVETVEIVDADIVVNDFGVGAGHECRKQVKTKDIEV